MVAPEVARMKDLETELEERRSQMVHLERLLSMLKDWRTTIIAIQ